MHHIRVGIIKKVGSSPCRKLVVDIVGGCGNGRREIGSRVAAGIAHAPPPQVIAVGQIAKRRQAVGIGLRR